MDSNGNFMVLNPGYTMGNRVSGWLSASQIETGMFHRIVVDTDGVGVADAGTAGSSSSSSARTPGFVAIVGTTTNINRETRTDGAGTESAAEALGISIENNVSDTVGTAEINYEDMVEPYTLSFDLLWDLLVTGNSKQFVMDLADLAYKSEIEVSVFDNQVTITDGDFWKYAEATYLGVHGSVTYKDTAENIYEEERVTHMHTILEEDPIKEEDGEIAKTIVTKSTQPKAALTKAYTWIMNYEVDFELGDPDEIVQEGTFEADDQEISKWNGKDVSIEEDTCGKIDEAKEKIVKRVNDIYVSKSYNDKKITKDDINTSRVRVTKKMERIKINDETTDSKVTQNYVTKGTPKMELKDSNDTKPNFVTLFNARKNYDAKNSILSATEWLFEIMEENDNTKNLVDIIKYLLFKATGVNYGVTDPNKVIDILFSKDLNSVGSGVGSYNVKIDTEAGKEIAPTKEQIKKALEYEAKKHHADIINGDLDKYWELQQSTKVNALFGIAVSVVETGCGTTTTGQYAAGTNNMFSWGSDFHGKDRAGRDADIEQFMKGIAGSTYFGAGKYTVKDISDPYCVPPETWEQSVTAEMTELMNKVGIKIPVLSGASNSLTAAADKVAKYIEENNFRYGGTGSYDYTFSIIGSSFRTLSCSSFIQECLLQAGYTQYQGGEKLWATNDKATALSYFTNYGVNAQLLPDLNSLQPGDILQQGYGGYHVRMVYAVNGNSIQIKGVPETLNKGVDYGGGFDGWTETINQLNGKGYYAIRIIN